MTALHLIRAPLRTGALARWAKDRGWVRRRRGAEAFDEGRALHHLLDETLGVGAVRPFRLLVPPRSHSGNLYGYSVADAEALRSAAQTLAHPEALSVLNADRIESKAMPIDWHEGQQLGFDLRTRPIRRLQREVETKAGNLSKGKEVDAFLLEALRQYPTSPEGMTAAKRSRQDVYLDWLAERLAPAAALDCSKSRLARFRRSVVSRGNHGSEGPDATIHGTLTVVDANAFAALLSGGVGRHKAYGYGMLLLRSPNKPAPKS